MSSGVHLHLSSGQAPSTTQGADAPKPCSEHSPMPCHKQGRANSTMPQKPKQPRAPVMMPLFRTRLTYSYWKCPCTASPWMIPSPRQEHIQEHRATPRPWQQPHPMDSSRAPMPGHGAVQQDADRTAGAWPSAVTSVNQLPGAAHRVGDLVGNEVLRLCAAVAILVRLKRAAKGIWRLCLLWRCLC